MSAQSVFPQVWIYPTREKGAHTVSKGLRRKRILLDINVTLVGWVAGRWYARNTQTGEEGDRAFLASRPTLQFPLVLGETYEGKVTLCTVLHNGGPLTWLERQAVRRAFRFRIERKPAPIYSTPQALSVLAEQAISAMNAQDRTTFDDIFSQMTDLHASLIQFGETRSNSGEPANYGSLPDRWDFGELQLAWARSYRRLFEEAVGFIDREPHYFGKLAYMAPHVISQVLSEPSLTGVTAIVDFQTYLWHRLNLWWGRNAEQQGLQHGLSKPVVLLEPLATVQSNAVKAFIAPWESLLKEFFRAEAERRTTWEAKTDFYPVLSKHLSETALFIARSVLSGNRDAAAIWIDVLLRWCGDALPWDSENHFYDLNLIQKTVLTPAMVKQGWTEVHDKLASMSDLANPRLSQESVFANLIFNMWQDTCFVLTSFLVQWAGNGEIARDTLALEAARKLLDRKLVDGSEPDGRTGFYETQWDFLASFLRRNTLREWAQDKAVPSFWRLAEQLEDLTREPMMVGRVYSWGGPAAGGIRAADLVLGSLRLQPDAFDASSLVRHFPQWLVDDREAGHLAERLTTITTDLAAMDIPALAPVFEYLDPKPAPHDAAGDLDAGVADAPPPVPPAQISFANRLGHFTSLVNTLSERIATYRRERITEASISPAKLAELARTVSDAVFSNNENSFVGHLFGPVKFTQEALEQVFAVRWTNFPKGVLTEPRLDMITGSEGILIQEVTNRLRSRALGQIKEAKAASDADTAAEVHSEAEFAAALLATCADLRSQHLTPLILLGSGTLPRWVRNWSNAAYRPDQVMPEGIVLERPQVRDKTGLLYLINGVKTYSTETNLGGVWVLAREAFAGLKITRADADDTVVQLNFTPTEGDPHHGALETGWRQSVETDASPLVRIKLTGEV